MARFSRQHYREIASWISMFDLSSQEEKAGLASFLAAKFAADNPNFNKGQFVAACGINKEGE